MALRCCSSSFLLSILERLSSCAADNIDATSKTDSPLDSICLMHLYIY